MLLATVHWWQSSSFITEAMKLQFHESWAPAAAEGTAFVEG
ncbi:MAG: hypothetical protein N838_13555 [Thiohalocapsa sp. PB-PSB1]|nr:MAG: hypothetical protein N838_13555 [Thiohalocapsa sp. PB-PSB1]